LLATTGDEPVGWLSLGPVLEFEPRLAKWAVAPQVLPEDAWAIVCLYVPKVHRRQGIAIRLLEEAATLARREGASALYGFPVHADPVRGPEGATGVGYVAQFLRAGFALESGPLESRPLAVMTFNSGYPGREGG
jgi:GNAT superfamily N-acetyltransferase